MGGRHRALLGAMRHVGGRLLQRARFFACLVRRGRRVVAHHMPRLTHLLRHCVTGLVCLVGGSCHAVRSKQPYAEARPSTSSVLVLMV